MDRQFCFSINDATSSRELQLDGHRFTIGRSSSNDICIEDREASRVHCAVEEVDGGIRLTDLGSQNGTFLNGTRVLSATLARGDVIGVGSAEIKLSQNGSTIVEERTSPLPPPDQLVKELSQERAFLLKLIAAARDVAEEQEITPLLERILDAVLDLTGAERSFIVLVGSDGSLETEVSRNFKGSPVHNADVEVSRSIAQEVIACGEGVFSINAREDERFRDIQSIVNLGVRSVLCVPLSFRGDTIGVVYIDNRLEEELFSERDRDRLQAFADQVAVAIANARAIWRLTDSNSGLSASRVRLESMNRDLRKAVRDRDNELATVRAQIMDDDPTGGDCRYETVGILGRSKVMRKTFELLDRVVESEFPVLIEGESGTGKELIARAIHRMGLRNQGPFVTENCAALPETLLESELFGSVKGAFTGAQTRRGLIERANGGTLFLDEVSEMSPALQAKILRFLQDGEFRPLGTTESVKVDARVISASNRVLRDLIPKKEFREDLFYRLNVLPITVPPLRDRKEDIPLLVERFAARLARDSGRQTPAISPDVLEVFTRHRWPGNVRELENEVRRLMTLCEDTLVVECVSTNILHSVPDTTTEDSSTLTGRVRALEIREIAASLLKYGGNKSQAASALGISRFALNRKMEKYGLDGDSDVT